MLLPCRDFARGLSEDHQELSLLVNNAGANYVSTWSTEEGVPGLVQVHAATGLRCLSVSLLATTS